MSSKPFCDEEEPLIFAEVKVHSDSNMDQAKVRCTTERVAGPASRTFITYMQTCIPHCCCLRLACLDCTSLTV